MMDIHACDVEELPFSKAAVRRFIKFSYRIYPRNSPWVAPLVFDLEKVFTKANPLFEHAELSLWMARRDGRDVGRICGILDHNYCKVASEPGVFFGFFECVDDIDIAQRLVAVVEQWASKRGVRQVLGPMNPTTNDECGLLIDGFEHSPAFMMPYNPAYYARLLESCGFAKSKDLLAYFIDLATVPMDRLARIGAKVQQRNKTLTFRPVRKKTLEFDLSQVKKIYNDAWQANWGFVPMTDNELNFMAARLKPLLMEGLIWLVEDGSDPVGFLLALPDYNVPLKPLRGNLVTPRILGFVPYLLGWKRPPMTRVLTLGVKQTHRSRGLESAMLIEGLKVGVAAGFTASEASWILEDNAAMCRVIEAIGGKVYKRYRIYSKPVSEEGKKT